MTRVDGEDARVLVRNGKARPKYTADDISNHVSVAVALTRYRNRSSFSLSPSQFKLPQPKLPSLAGGSIKKCPCTVAS